MAEGENLRELVAASLAAQDPTGWFEPLYAAAEAGQGQIPWDRGEPHPLLVAWADARGRDAGGRRALVVGCGLGADAEFVAGLGYETTAFDISPSAVRAARERAPDSAVHYLAADLLHPPAGWRGAFDFVLESLTVQSLPDPPRADAIARVAGMVAPAGTLLVIASARDESAGSVDGPPWPLTRREVESFAGDELVVERIDELGGPGHETPHRWRAQLRRPDRRDCSNASGTPRRPDPPGRRG